jgi:hypothetical protein
MTSCLRSPLHHFQYSGENVKKLHWLSKCCRRRCCYTSIRLQLNDCRNTQFKCSVNVIFLWKKSAVSSNLGWAIRQASSSPVETAPCAGTQLLVIVPITQPGSLSSHSLPYSVLSSSSSAHYLHPRNFQHHSDCLRLQPSSAEKAFQPLCLSVRHGQVF